MIRIHSAVPAPIIISVVLAFLFISSTRQYEVTGILVDRDQNPVAGLSVMLFNDKDEQIASDQTDSQGHFSLVYQVEPTSADPFGSPDMPTEFKLGSSYPNPFNPQTTVPFYAPENTQAVISVYNILGQQVLRTQVDVSAGSHEIQVNLGGRLSQGQYILRVQGDGFSLTQSMTFVSAGVSSGRIGIVLRPATGQSVANLSSQALQAAEEKGYRLVVEGSAAFEVKELSIPINQNHDLGAIKLIHNEYPLKIIVEGQGSVEEEILTAKQYEHGTVVRLTALPEQRWRFSGWSGAVEDLEEIIEIEITQPVTIQASFELAEADFTGKIVSSEDGEGIPLTQLRLQRDSLIFEQKTDEHGAFAFREIPVGEYEISIRYPLGYRGVDELDSLLLLDRDLSMELIAEPVREITKIISSGQRDTLSTVTGAVVVIDLSDSSVDIEVEVSQVESPRLTQNNHAVTEPVRVRIGNPAHNKQPGLHMPPAESDSITITLIQQFTGDDDSAFFLLDTGLEEEESVSYANGVRAIYTDLLGRVTEVMKLTYKVSAQIKSELTYALALLDSECSSEDRSLYELSEILDGEKPLILIHGWQPFKVRCSHFADYDPVEEVFSGLIKELKDDPEISSTYKLYIFKYTSNTSVLSNSEVLWQRMNEMGLAEKKPFLIGHSMGGLVGRGLINMYGEDFVDGLITLGGPHEGIPLTRTPKLLRSWGRLAVCAYSQFLCTLMRVNSGIVPETPGFMDLDPESQLIKSFKAVKGSSEHIFALAGRLDSRSETNNFVYKQGYSILRFGDSRYSENDGIVHVQSAMPYWTGLRVILDAHDHSEVATGIGSNAKNVFDAIAPILKKQDEVGDWPRDTQTAVVEVFNPATGRTWMDRNLGASRAATSSTDEEAYGDLYQWGRAADGHQRRNSSTTSTLSSTDQPGHGSFITSSSGANWDWRSPQNDDLWQGVNGINNPCPVDYRLPTDAEWIAERNSWSSNNAAGAYASPLKLPMAGIRYGSSGSLGNVGAGGGYWSSTVSGSYARYLLFGSGNAFMYSFRRADGLSVRCLKDE